MKVILFILWVLSLILYTNSPETYSYGFVVTCGVIATVTMLFLYINLKPTNWLSFDLIFCFSFLVTNFFYPVFFYFDPPYLLFEYPFNEHVISRATALATCGLISWVFGRLYGPEVSKKSYVIAVLPQHNLILQEIKKSNSKLIIFASIVFILFLIQVGSSFLKGEFMQTTEWGGGATYTYKLLLIVMQVALIIEIVVCWYFRDGLKHFNILLIILLITFSIIFLAAGDRGGPLQLIIIAVSTIGFTFRPFKLKETTLAFVIGLAVFSIIGLARLMDVNETGNMASRIFEVLNQNKNEDFNIFKDLTINSRTLYVALDYIEKGNDYFYGRLFLSDIFAVVPFLNSTFLELTLLKPYQINGPEFLTYIELGENAKFGMGTNLIAGLFLNFGLLGVIFLMLIFGAVVKYFTIKMEQDRKLISYIIYGILISYSVYLTRSELFAPLMSLVWAILIFKIFFIRLFYKFK